jgi:hypothetical protein
MPIEDATTVCWYPNEIRARGLQPKRPIVRRLAFKNRSSAVGYITEKLDETERYSAWIETVGAEFIFPMKASRNKARA